MSSLVGLELRFALDALVNKIPRTVMRDNGSTCQVWDDCLLDQLANLGQGGESGSGGAHSKPGSKPPVPIDVLALRVDIRDAIAGMWRAGLPNTGTAAQLRAIVDHLIETNQWAAVYDWTELLRAWALRINDLSGVERPRSRPLPIDCPACRQRWQYVTTDGETVRRPILSALFDGDVMLSLDCASCGSWQRGPALDALVTFMRAA